MRNVSSLMRPGLALALLAVSVIFVGLFFRLGHLPLSYPDEGRNAEVAREMKESGAWLVPTYNGVDYLDKPAFYFKAVALSLAAFGDNETAARLPSALFGLGLVVMTFAFCRRQYGTRVGLLAAIVVASTPLFVANARTVIFDIALAFFVCGAIFAGYLAEEAEGKARRNWYLLGAAATGFATLVKGPVGFVLPLLVLLVFHRLEGRRGVWKRLFAPLNIAVFFAITLPWFVGLCLVHRDFLHYGLIEETFNRFTSAKKFQRSEPVYFYFFVVASAFFPWSVLLPEASVATWRQRLARHSADRLCLVWSVVVILFFSVSQSKLPGYILTVTVACGILVARIFRAAMLNPGGRASRLVGSATMAFSVIAFTVAVIAAAAASKVGWLTTPIPVSSGASQAAATYFATLYGAMAVFFGFGMARLVDTLISNAATRIVLRAAIAVAVLCSIVTFIAVAWAHKRGVINEPPLSISADYARKLASRAPPLILSLVTFGVFALVARLRGTAELRFVSLSLFPPAFLALNLGIPEAIFETRASRQLAREFPSLPPGTELASLACYPSGLSFYLGRTMTLFTADGNELTSNYILFGLQKRTQNKEPWPRNLKSFNELTVWLTSRKTPAFLIVPQQNREQARAILGIRGATVHELSPDYFGILLPTPGGP